MHFLQQSFTEVNLCLYLYLLQKQNAFTYTDKLNKASGLIRNYSKFTTKCNKLLGSTMTEKKTSLKINKSAINSHASFKKD